ncbi:MAG: hypothetical protein MMC33_007064 [Icmadophila ericetorum]|nr:hypothetical protein [Icmadophila ericetorum]
MPTRSYLYNDMRPEKPPKVNTRGATCGAGEEEASHAIDKNHDDALKQIDKDNEDEVGDRAKFQRLKEKIKTQPYPRTSCNDYFDLASLEKKFAKDPYGKDRANAANNDKRASQSRLSQIPPHLTEVINDPSFLLPGVGEVVGVGMKLAVVTEKVVTSVADIAKAARGVKDINDAVKYGLDS